MGTQTTVNGPPGPAVIKRSISRVMYDFITLCELQAKITRLDLATAMPVVLSALALTTIALVVGIAGTVIVLGAIAFAIADSFAVPIPLALGGVGLASCFIAYVFMQVGMGRIRRSGQAFGHTHDEFHRNVETVKTSLMNE